MYLAIGRKKQLCQKHLGLSLTSLFLSMLVIEVMSHSCLTLILTVEALEHLVDAPPC